VDFARSWAIGFLTRAALPAVFLTGLLCCGLSGLKLIDLDQRGVYERLGAPVAVLGPGLHLLLPWPLGRLRPVELGVIHGIAVGSEAPPEAGDPISAEAIPPDSANRLWETAHATEVNYLVASQSGALQSFQLVSTEILVLYRTGLTDPDALQAVYGAADQSLVVREAASRLATRFFSRRTLEQVMGAQPSTLADQLRRDLAADVAAAQAGIEILAVVIEEIHPPAGAASAYHMVQAAEINANASISDEIGRATRMKGIAQQEARQMDDAAQATATESLTTANAAAYSFNADRLAYQASPGPFLLERNFADLAAALAQVPLTLVDHRIGAGQGPLLDLRPAQGAAGDLTVALPAAAPPAKDTDGTPGTFSYVTPNSTADTTPQTPDAAQDATPGAQTPP
jgi:regulator of protease activity HflC (stomatin/prohibitin superfamily)